MRKLTENQKEILVAILNEDKTDKLVKLGLSWLYYDKRTLRSLHKLGFIDYVLTGVVIDGLPIKKVKLTKEGENAAFKALGLFLG